MLGCFELCLLSCSFFGALGQAGLLALFDGTCFLSCCFQGICLAFAVGSGTLFTKRFTGKQEEAIAMFEVPSF